MLLYDSENWIHNNQTKTTIYKFIYTMDFFSIFPRNISLPWSDNLLCVS